MNKVIVTGGAGFIGSHIVDALIRSGAQVISIDNYIAGSPDNLTKHPNLKEVYADVSDFTQIEEHFEGVDAVFHNAASKMTVCKSDPRRDLEVNAAGTLNILELSKRYGIRKVVHASTGSVYGVAKYHPTDEDHPLNPVYYYGVSKLAGEKYVRMFFETYGMDVTVLRYYHVYGPRQDSGEFGGVVGIFAKRALQNKPLIIFGDGSQVRSFTYVDDVVSINKFVASMPYTKGEAYNCASGTNISILDLANRVLSYYEKEDLGIEFRDWKRGDIKNFDVDNSKLKDLGFYFDTEFDEGLSRTLDWYYENFNNR